MNAIGACPDPASLQALVDGSLSEIEQATLATHLETCQTCQESIQQLVAGSVSWANVAQQLDSGTKTAEPAMNDVLARMKATLTPGETASGGVVREIPVDFLSPSDKPGQLGRLNHYEILEVIGRGAMGVVFRALDPKLQRIVAIKALAPQLATTAAARRRFEREAKAAAAVSHDHVIAIHSVEEANGVPYIVMYYVQGVSLQERLDRTGPLEVKEILRIGLQTAQGLAAAHAQGLVHRDIKPANILLENGIERVKLTDFGLARAVDDATLTQSGVIAGTPQYMAPEQARGETVDHRADLFSLGSVLYALCTGRPPFRATTMMGVLKRVNEDTPRPIREINPDIPDWLCAIIGKLHVKDPAERYQTAKEVAELLGQCLAHVQQPGTVELPFGIPSVVGADHSDAPTVHAVALKTGARPLEQRARFDWRSALTTSGLAVGALAILYHFVFSMGWMQLNPNPVLVVLFFGAVFGIMTLLVGFGRYVADSFRKISGDNSGMQPALAEGAAAVPRASLLPAPMERAQRLLRWPAIGLGVTGVLYWLSIPIFFVASLSDVIPEQAFEYLWWRWGVLPIVVGCILLLAAFKLRQLEWYWFCVLATCVPVGLLMEKLITLQGRHLTMTMGDWTALPFGIWALIVLLRNDVRTAFERHAADAAPTPSTAGAETPTSAPARSSKAAWLVRLALGLMAIGGIVQLTLLIHWASRGRFYFWAMAGVVVGVVLLVVAIAYHFYEQRRMRLATTSAQPARLGRWLALVGLVLLVLGPAAVFVYQYVGAAPIAFLKLENVQEGDVVECFGQDGLALRLEAPKPPESFGWSRIATTFQIVATERSPDAVGDSNVTLKARAGNYTLRVQRGGTTLWDNITLVADETLTHALPQRTRYASVAATLDGRWVHVATEYQGQTVSEEAAKGQYPSELFFKGDQYGIVWGDKRHEGGLRIDAKKAPAEIDFSGSVFEGLKPRQAIYELTGDRLKLCLAFVGPNADPPRPTTFKTDPQSKNVALTYQRVATKEPTPATPFKFVIKTLRPPSDKLIDHEGVTVEGDGWRIESTAARTVRLIEIPNPRDDDCQFTARVEIKMANPQECWARPDAWSRMPDGREFHLEKFQTAMPRANEWIPFEVPAPAVPGHRPELIRLNVVTSGKGTIWIRKIELVAQPTGNSDAPTELRRIVALQENKLRQAKERHDLGQEPLPILLATEVELHEAKIKLAEAEKKPVDVQAALRAIVKNREQLVDFAKARKRAGIVVQAEVDEAEIELAKARARSGRQ